jgi:hypothetical protein
MEQLFSIPMQEAKVADTAKTFGKHVLKDKP